MKNTLIVFMLMLLAACGLDKMTKVKIINHNDFPISVTLKTNNISQKFEHIASQETFQGSYIWTGLDDSEGQWHISVKNDNTNGIDTFVHGYFINGDLGNYFDAECTGDQLKIRISN